jgi:putative transposase
MPYDPERHHRRSTRLPGFDYTQPAAYFLTICTHDWACLFGAVRDGVMHLNEIGRVVDEEWRRSEAVRAEVVPDTYVVMPNHLHGIVLLRPPGAGPAVDRPVSDPDVGSPKSLGSLAAGFKSSATKRANAVRGMPGAPVWQYKFYDRILRDERAWCAGISNRTRRGGTRTGITLRIDG